MLSAVTIAAADTGEVNGTVSTGDGYALEDADVRLVNITTEDTRSTTTDSDGSYSFASVEPGLYRIEAEFKGGEAVEDVTVEGGETRSLDLELTPEEAYFTVSVQGTNSPVTAGEDARVDVTVENRGEESGAEAVALRIPGVGDTAEPVSLDGGASRPVTLSIPTEIGDGGEYTAEVSIGNDTAEVGLVVEERENGVDVSITDTNSPVTEGETLTVDAELSNPGDVRARGTVTAEADGVGSDTAGFSLEGGESGTESFEIQTESGDAGDYTVTVSVGDSADSSDVTIEGAAGEGDGGDNETGTDGGSGDEGTNDGQGEGADDTNGSAAGDDGSETGGSGGGDGEDGDAAVPLGLSAREVLRYLGIGIGAIVAVTVLLASSVFAARRLREKDWGEDASDEGVEREPVFDPDPENEVYASWSGMVERAGVRDVRTKTTKEIAEMAKESGLDPDAVDELTDVYEEVYYRDAEPTARQESRAKEAFERIKRSDAEE